MLSEAENRVVRSIDKNREDIIECLRKLVSFKTITIPEEPIGKVTSIHKNVATETDRIGSKGLLDFVATYLNRMSFELKTIEIESKKLKTFPGSGVRPERDLRDMLALVGTIKGTGRGKSLILNGHYDVVPVGIRENWKHDPFRGEVENGRLFGRGACDMKGGIAAMLEAIRFIQKSDVEFKGDITVQIVPDEEITGMGTLACCQAGYKADAAIIPEPSDMNLIVAMRGNLNGRITIFGRSGHADVTQPHWREGGAVNAITKSVKIIGALEELTEDWRKRPDKKHRFLDPDIVVPTLIRGGEWVIMYPEQVVIGFNSDFIPDTRDIEKEIRERIASVSNTDSWMKEHPPTIETNPWQYGAEIDENEPIVTTTKEAAREFGINARPKGWNSMTDAIHLVNYSKIPTVSIGPASKTAHMADEFIEIGELTKLTKILAVTIMRWSRTL